MVIYMNKMKQMFLLEAVCFKFKKFIELLILYEVEANDLAKESFIFR